MKYLQLKTINLFIIVLLFLSLKVSSQISKVGKNDLMETIVTSGSNATGDTGTVTYSIGQVFYTYVGDLSVYNLAQGVQHDEKSDSLGRPEVSIGNKTEIFIFPNPTTDFVNISMQNTEVENGQRNYKLYDIQGRLLKQGKIDQDQTQIGISHLSSSIYILQVYIDNKSVKTFKILKK